MSETTTPKLTCAPEPPPICSVVNGVTVCLAPPVRCVGTCNPAGVCTSLCCAAFAPDATPVPTLGGGMLALVVVLVAVVGFFVRANRSRHAE